MRKFCLLLLLCSCQRYGLVLHQQKIDESYLASSHVGSPDPRKKCPPEGSLLVIEWWVPKYLLSCDPRLRLHLLFRNHTEQIVEYPICSRIGYEVYELVNSNFENTCGLLTYKAEIVTADGSVFRDWTHQMWVNLID